MIDDKSWSLHTTQVSPSTSLEPSKSRIVNCSGFLHLSVAFVYLKLVITRLLIFNRRNLCTCSLFCTFLCYDLLSLIILGIIQLLHGGRSLFVHCLHITLLSDAEVTFLQCTKKEKIVKIILTLSCWYSLESSCRALSYEYPFARVSNIFHDFPIIWYWPN